MPLQERTIQQVALGFIKGYYRHRPRAPLSPTVSGLDMKGDNGVTIDGFIRFTTDQNEPFMATFEATSYAVRDEVYFKARLDLIRWDATAFATFFTALIFASLHIIGPYPLIEYGWIGMGIGLIGCFLLVFLISYFIMPMFRRYRYIFAIEQFKQFHADEQWVAVAFDVFSGIEDRYYKELRRQCVRWGVGLLMVDDHRTARMIMAPARAKWFAAKQRRVRLIPIRQLNEQLQKIPYKKWFARWREFWGRFSKPITAQKQYRWFTETYPKQAFLFGTSLMLILSLLYLEWKEWPIKYISEKAYERQLDKNVKGIPETDYYLIDAPIAKYGEEGFQPYVLPKSEEAFADLTDSEIDLDAVNADDLPKSVILSRVGEMNLYYADCERFYGYDTTIYLVRDTFLANLATAENRLARYETSGLDGMAVWSACLSGVSVGYELFVDEIYLDSLLAAGMRDSLQNQLQRDSLNVNLRLVGLKPN